MAQTQLARITCSVCNGWYNSESELRDHMQTFIAGLAQNKSTLQHGGTQPDKL